MNLNQLQIADARKVYKNYWDSYLVGDIDTFATTLDDNFEMIGTFESELCHNKAEGIEFFKGQAEEIKDKILQLFFTTKKGTQGTGLGLSITNDIIKAHRGELEIKTQPGGLTCFIIKLAVD